MADVQYLQKHIKNDGYLVLSGFYENDIQDILTECEKFSLSLVNQSSRNQWSALLLKKNK
jgi:ribosomal protein L11 methyltransferase